MRMSSGPSARKLKPRAGSSSWNEETPRSSTTPSSDGHAGAGEQRDHVAEAAVQQMQPAGMAGGQRGAAGDGVGIAVDRPQGAVDGAEDRRRIAAAAERAVEIDAAVARRQGGEHLVQHHRNVAGLEALHGESRP